MPYSVSFLLPAPGERLQRILASCPVAVRRHAAALVLPMGQSPAPGCSWWRRFGQSDVTNDYVPSEDPVLVSDWAAALEQKVGHVLKPRGGLAFVPGEEAVAPFASDLSSNNQFCYGRRHSPPLRSPGTWPPSPFRPPCRDSKLVSPTHFDQGRLAPDIRSIGRPCVVPTRAVLSLHGQKQTECNYTQNRSAK